MIRAEFAIYPFQEGETPPVHVQAAIEEVRKSGLDFELGPFGQAITGPAEEVLAALKRAQEAAIQAGATQVVVNLEVVE